MEAPPNLKAGGYLCAAIWSRGRRQSVALMAQTFSGISEIERAGAILGQEALFREAEAG